MNVLVKIIEKGAIEWIELVFIGFLNTLTGASGVCCMAVLYEQGYIQKIPTLGTLVNYLHADMFG